jgi:hypothetical protein
MKEKAKMRAQDIMQKFLIVVFLGCFSLSLRAQFVDSNLPIVIIETQNNVSIPDKPRVTASMKIIYRGPGERNLITDESDESKLNYNGRITIEVRGSSSQALPKKQYALTTVLEDNVTNRNVSLLGMPSENDWILNGLAFDASYMRDYISYNLSLKMGNYAPRQRYCEVFINDVYSGLYILQEKIKVDDNRVDIVKIAPTSNGGSDLSGGYIVKADKVADEDVPSWSMPTYLGSTTDFIHESPNLSKITTEQKKYIKEIFLDLESEADNSSVTEGFPSIIDVPSFIDFMLVNELSANVDAYQFSTFFHKDKNGKLRAGPLFDLNLTYGNDLTFWGLDRSKTNLWQFDNGDNVGPKFWRDLYNDPTFHCYLSRRWNEMTAEGQPLNPSFIDAFIDETAAYISEAVARDHDRWGFSEYLSNEVVKIKDFVAQRFVWMTAQLGSFSACASVATPPLVINRINYHPETSSEFLDEDDLEFVEIINNGNEPVDLTGFYFSGTGFVYQFNQDSVLRPNDVIQLASNIEQFRKKYGYEAYGHYIHNLSNTSQKLTLSDAFGNIIDEVEYSDTDPWPAADANGMYLKLSDPSLDNNVGSNWIASTEAISSTIVVVGIDEDISSQIDVSPNPSENMVKISSRIPFQFVQLRNIQGQLLETVPSLNNEAFVELGKYPSGIYLVIIQTKDEVVIKKVIVD